MHVYLKKIRLYNPAWDEANISENELVYGKIYKQNY